MITKIVIFKHLYLSYYWYHLAKEKYGNKETLWKILGLVRMDPLKIKAIKY